MEAPRRQANGWDANFEMRRENLAMSMEKTMNGGFVLRSWYLNVVARYAWSERFIDQMVQKFKTLLEQNPASSHQKVRTRILLKGLQFLSSL